MVRAGQKVQRLARAILSGRLEKRTPALPSLFYEHGPGQLCSVSQLPAARETDARQGSSVGHDRHTLRGGTEACLPSRDLHSKGSSTSMTHSPSPSFLHFHSQPVPHQPQSRPITPPCRETSNLVGTHSHPHLRVRELPGAFAYTRRELANTTLKSGASLRWGIPGLGFEEEAGVARWEGERRARGGWSYQQSRELSAAKVSGSDVKVGNVIERKGKMLEVVKTQHTQQGRGGATIQVELRDIQSGLKSTEKLRTAEPIEVVFVDAKPFSFLYSEGDVAHLMDPETYDQLSIPQRMLGDAAKLLKEGMQVQVKYFNGEPLMASLPARVTVKVVEAEPHVKGNTATPSYKKVTVEGGLTVGVPPFVVEGDEIVVQTSDMTYVTRA